MSGIPAWKVDLARTASASSPTTPGVLTTASAAGCRPRRWNRERAFASAVHMSLNGLSQTSVLSSKGDRIDPTRLSMAFER